MGRLIGDGHPVRRLIRNDAEAVAAFTAEAMNQPPGLFVSQATGFTASLADHRPLLHFKFAGHGSHVAQTLVCED
jgi:hypothetical protein